MKCPHCGDSGSPSGTTTWVSPTWVIIIYCPHCETILGAVYKPKD